MPAARQLFAAAAILAAVPALAATASRPAPRPLAAWCTIHSTTVGAAGHTVTTPEVTYPCP
ncbi:MAG TPA: hypothetical protein VFQ85_08255 [Mycobacteriales bacterium]|jgi:hypothetical protein|nr:hypothetical protein [Mycobacteriales bacterium]